MNFNQTLCLVAALGIATIMVGLAVIDHRKQRLVCPAGYSTEYTSSGHKFCLRVMQDCRKE